MIESMSAKKLVDSKHRLIVLLVLLGTLFIYFLWQISPNHNNQRSDIEKEEANFITDTDLSQSYPFSGQLSFFSTEGWSRYIFDVGYVSNGMFQKQGELELLLPQNVTVTEKSLVEPEKTLIISNKNSTLYIGDPKLFSTSGNLYCISCQQVGYLAAQILDQTIHFPIVQQSVNSSHQFISKNNLVLEPCINCIYDASIRAASLDDFLLFLQILETMQYRPN